MLNRRWHLHFLFVAVGLLGLFLATATSVHFIKVANAQSDPKDNPQMAGHDPEPAVNPSDFSPTGPDKTPDANGAKPAPPTNNPVAAEAGAPPPAPPPPAPPQDANAGILPPPISPPPTMAPSAQQAKKPILPTQPQAMQTQGNQSQGIQPQVNQPQGLQPQPTVTQQKQDAQAALKNRADMKAISDISFLEPYAFDMREGRRNPFKPPMALDDSLANAALPGTPLERYELEEIKLVGIMWQIKAPKAMFIDPAGEVHVLTKDDRIGRKHGYIAAIREGEVVVFEPNNFGGESAFSTRILQIERDRKK